MQIVINISEEDFERCKKKFQMRIDIMGDAIANGTPLPKGHGRLIDADALLKDVKDNSESYFADDFTHEWVDVAPTIIEADTPKRRKGTPLEENDSGYNCENWIP